MLTDDAVQKYLDELFIDALKEAPLGVVLEPLKAIRSSLGKEYAEYKDLSSTIDILEKAAGLVIVLQMCYSDMIRTMID